MKTLLVVAMMLAGFPALATDTVLVAVGTSPTPMPSTIALARKAVLLENTSSVDIWCRYGAPGSSAAPTIVIGQGHRVAAGQWRSFTGETLWCQAASAQAGCSPSSNECTAVTEFN